MLTPERLAALEALRDKWHTPPDSTRIGRALDDLLRERAELVREVATLRKVVTTYTGHE